MEDRLTNTFLKTLLTHNTKSCIKQKPAELIWKLFFHLNLHKLKLVLGNFISTLKSFILFSVFYAQPKIRNFGLWQTTPLNKNLVLRFRETREKDKQDLHASTLPSFGIHEMKE